MVAALYRRYRPETFAELIGQSQVTDPLRTALRTDRVNHAYLFSGPRGCGKTTSARILARCLNCAEGPTDTPCGVCASCVELSRDGSGSLDVVEIDAASHNGVDDARDLRERAIFAPARDRYKIFILDEAHMVTPQGFNALLKIVEEPPEHVKFIFATTEPDKVIGTIRSRTHHYPFRLVPPNQMLDYLQQLCDSEKVTVEPGVLPLVVRAGGGSVRDSLSLLDQLIAGSDGPVVLYERAVALLGYTHGTLLNSVIDALGSLDAASAFGAVDRVIQTGQDPRRFVEDLLERLRDLIVVGAVSVGGSAAAAAAVLPGIQADELERMNQQAQIFGAASLSRAADVANAALTEMTGATSPRLHLELMVARILLPASDDSQRGALARVERLERRVGVETGHALTAPEAVDAAGVASLGDLPDAPGHPSEPTQPASISEVHEARHATGVSASAPAYVPSGTAPGEPDRGRSTGVGLTVVPAEPQRPEDPVQPSSVAEVHAPVQSTAATTGRSATGGAAAGLPVSGVPVTFDQMKDAWPQILDALSKADRGAWLAAVASRVHDFRDDVLVLVFHSENDTTKFRTPAPGHTSVSEYLRRAILDVLGVRVKFSVRKDPGTPAPTASSGSPAGSPDRARATARSATATTTSTAAATTASATESGLEASPSPTAPLPPTGQSAPSAAAPSAAAPSVVRPTAAASSVVRPTASASEKRTVAPKSTTKATPSAPTTTWATVVVPDGDAPIDEADREPEPEFEPEESPVFASVQATATTGSASSPSVSGSANPPAAGNANPPAAPVRTRPALDKQRYGESVVREILGAQFIEELSVVPRVTPRGE